MKKIRNKGSIVNETYAEVKSLGKRLGQKFELIKDLKPRPKTRELIKEDK